MTGPALSAVRPLLLLPFVLCLAGCASSGPSSIVTPEAPVAATETRTDLVRAFADRGWRAVPIEHVRPVGVEGEAIAYRVEGRRVVVYDYGTPEAADAQAPADAVRLRRLEAGRGVELYRRPTLLILTYGRTRTAFDLHLAALLTGPPLVVQR